MNGGIALLIPCYHAARYLPRLLETVRAQTRPYAEIIAYDDGSQDETVAVARSSGVQIIEGKVNRGPAFARNRLAERSSADWLHFFDADDLLEPMFVEKMSRHLDANVDVALCQANWLREDTRALEIAWRYPADALRTDALRSVLTNPMGVTNAVIRRTRFQAIGGFDETLLNWEDADLQVRLAAAGARYAVAPEVLVIALRHDSGVSADPERRYRSRVTVLERYARELPALYRAVVAAEAEGVAADLLAQDRYPELIGRALAICQTLDFPVPSTRQPLLRLARSVLPSRWLLKTRERYRRSRSAHS